MKKLKDRVDSFLSKAWAKLKELSKNWAFILFVAIALALAVTMLTSCSLIGVGAPAIGMPPMDANGDGILDQTYKDYIHNAKAAADAVSGGAAAPATGLLELVITGISSVVVALGARKVDHVIKAKRIAKA